jgi:hypothetical protein
VTATTCRKAHEHSGKSCVQRMAAGWLDSASDLCSACTARFMVALNTLGESLAWHEGYLRRSVGGGS